MNDDLMRFFDHCTRFVEEVDENPAALSEVDKFKQGPEMRRVQEKIADRLKVPYNTITDGQWWRWEKLADFNRSRFSSVIVQLSIAQ